MSKTYTIDDNWTLHQVYLAWLIAVDPQEYLRENDITTKEILSFRNDNRNTWGNWDD